MEKTFTGNGMISEIKEINKSHVINPLTDFDKKVLDYEESDDKINRNGVKLTILNLDDTYEYIYCVVNNDQNCCETWGHMVLPDEYDDFIGAKLLSLDVVLSKDLINYINDPELAQGLYEYEDIVFINIQTSSGLLQITLYNDHNGYYGHQAAVCIGSDKENKLTNIFNEVI